MADTEELKVDFSYDGGARTLAVNAVDVDFDPHPDDDDDFEGFVIGGAANSKRWEMKVLSIGNWPEFKTKTCRKKVNIPLDGWTWVYYPCAWRRTCNKAWYLTIIYSGGGSLPDKIEQIIQDCAKIALIPAIPLLVAGQPAAAAAAFLEAFKTCLIQKGIKELSGWSIGFDSRKSCGAWQRV